MRAAVALRTALYPPLADLLLATGERQIWEASDPNDLFWVRLLCHDPCEPFVVTEKTHRAWVVTASAGTNMGDC